MTNARDNIILSAHTGKLEAAAKQDMNVASSTKAVEIVAANRVTLIEGDGDIKINPKQFTEKGGNHIKAEGGKDGLGLVGLPSALLAIFDEQLNLKNELSYNQ